MNLAHFLMASVVCLLISVVFSIITSKVKYKKQRKITPLTILLSGAVLSSVILFVPIYLNVFKSSECGVFEAVINAIYSMIQLFAIDGDFEIIVSNIAGAPTMVFKLYTILFSVLFLVIPFLTVGCVLSFFKNISAHSRYNMNFNSDVYIFSELNEKSIALAESLYKNNSQDRFFAFTDVSDSNEKSGELLEKAYEIGAVCFKKNIVTINFFFHSKKKGLNFFAISNDEAKNVAQSLNLIEKFKFRENTRLYVFSTSIEGELLLANSFKDMDSKEDSKTKEPYIKVRRVNEIQSLINRNLYDEGFENIFGSAWQDDGTKRINAVIVGMGGYGTEMTKALTWFGQMDGYLVQINSFDICKNAENKFTELCPELMKFSGKLDIQGEAKYTLSIHSGVDVETIEFDNIINALPRTTYVFVALGDDRMNISTAVKLRSLFARKGYYPKIQAVVYSTEKKEALKGITNYKNQEYDIDFIGDLTSSYSENVIIDSEIEKTALNRHLKWGKETEFWQYDYNYKSSIASAIHRKMKMLCKISGIEKAPKDRTEEELWSLRILEHKRWNAYIRSEGYVYGGTIDKSGRNDLAKTHNCLVPFFELPLEEQIKDDD